jgi:hypothetical protein
MNGRRTLCYCKCEAFDLIAIAIFVIKEGLTQGKIYKNHCSWDFDIQAVTQGR